MKAKPLLCNSREVGPDTLTAPFTREDCMNTVRHKTVAGTFIICKACDMWESEKSWKLGKEKVGWQDVFKTIKLRVFIMTMVSTLPFLVPYFLTG